MPHYDYCCEACGHELELFQRITESPRRKCPECGRLRLRRKIGGGAGLLFKGSGFYQTDYKKSGAPPAQDRADSKKDTPGKASGEGPAKTGGSPNSGGPVKGGGAAKNDD